MKTTFELKDGSTEIIEDGMPVCAVADELVVGVIDSGSSCLTDDIPLHLVARIIFEND